MTARITDAGWDKLSPENFETHSLLRAVDVVDELRGPCRPLHFLDLEGVSQNRLGSGWQGQGYSRRLPRSA
jgi:hypothetical protein